MVAIKSEKKGKEGGGGGGDKKKGGGGSSSNNPASKKKGGPLHPALYMANKRMMEILRCDKIELDLLKHGAAKIVKRQPNIQHKELRCALSEQEPEWAEMLSGERWDGEEYPGEKGFEKDVEHVLIKIKAGATNKVNRKMKRTPKRGQVPEGAEVIDVDGEGGESDDGAYMMSGGLRNDTPVAQLGTPPPPRTFRKLSWLHKDRRDGGQSATPSPPQGGADEDEEEEDLYGATPVPPSRAQRARPEPISMTEGGPTSASRHRRLEVDDDDAGFTGVFNRPARSRDPPGSKRGAQGRQVREGDRAAAAIQIDSGSESD